MIEFYSETGRTENPLARLLLFCGFTLPELKFKLRPFVVLLGPADQ